MAANASVGSAATSRMVVTVHAGPEEGGEHADDDAPSGRHENGIPDGFEEGIRAFSQVNRYP